MNVLCCNIRCSVANDGPNSWENRKRLCMDVIRSQSADLICFQEMWADQHADFTESFPGYSEFATIDEPNGRNPVNCIFYRTNAFRRISAGGYWLSENPHVPGSRSWNSEHVRLANWLRLEESASGMEFRLINTHLDNVSQAARENQARTLNEDAAAYPPGYPQMLTGDMNCDCRNRAINILRSAGWADTYFAAHGVEDPGHTFHEFLGPRYESGPGKMDWIFTRGEVHVTGADIVRDSVDGRFPSDHYFVSAQILLHAPDPGASS